MAENDEDEFSGEELDDEDMGTDMDNKRVLKQGQQKKKYKKEVDTNVCNIKFSVLEDSGALDSGDPNFCKECHSVFNMYSKIDLVNKEGQEEQQQLWNCEFCNAVNEIHLEKEEIPKASGVNYIIEAAQAKIVNVASEEEEQKGSEV